MCTDVWTSCSIQLSVRQGRQHAQGGCALITSTIVKVIFCNGVIQDCDCKGGILKGVFWKETACLSCLLGMFCVQGAGLNLHTRTGTKELWCSGQIQSSALCCRESYANAAISVVYHGAQLSVCLQSCSSNFPHRCDSVAVRNNLRMQRLILPCSLWGSSLVNGRGCSCRNMRHLVTLLPWSGNGEMDADIQPAFFFVSALGA